jgi:hypothetical protein
LHGFGLALLILAHRYEHALLVHSTNRALGESTYARLIDRNDIDKLVAETNSSLSLEKAVEMLYLST